MRSLFCLWAFVRIVLRAGQLWELKLCVILRYFHLYDNTNSEVYSWGFLQSILLCFMCIDSASGYMCSAWSCSNLLSFHKFYCRSRLNYFALVILHYQVNLQWEFLHGIGAKVIRVVNSILKREFEVWSSRLQVKIKFISYFRLVNGILWLETRVCLGRQLELHIMER